MARKRTTLDAIRLEPDRRVLQQLHLESLEELWREIGKDLDGLDPLVQAGADRARLIRDLMDSAACEADEKGASWPRRHFLDLMIAGALLGFVALLGWALPRAGSAGLALRDLRAGERVSADSLHGSSPDRIANRRLTRDVPHSGYVQSGWLAQVPPLAHQDLRGRFRMFLRIPAEDLHLLPTLPARASLAASAGGEEPPRGLLLRDVPILAAERSGESLTLDAALTQAQILDLLPLLSKVQIRVVRPVL